MLYIGCAKKKYADLKARTSAEWVNEAVIYQVYLRAFSNEGTFKALETRIPELKNLGVTIISLMPIHPIGELNRRGKLGSPYAVKDFYAVNPEFGTLDDFKSLVKSAHQYDLKIIIDLVANHAAWDSQLLMEHPDWFVHNEEGAIVSPHPDWIDVAKIDYRQHEPRKYMIAVMKYWVKDIGIDGFRCNVADLVPTEFWEVARNEVEKIKPVVMISESSLPEHHRAAFDLSYSWKVYNALTALTDDRMRITTIDDSLKAEQSQFPQRSLLLNFISTPERNMEDGPAVERFSSSGAKAAAVLMFTLPGVPIIYNGEEIGNRRRLDLFNKSVIEWPMESDMMLLYERLGAQRKTHPSLQSGSYTFLPNSESTKVYTFLRALGMDSVFIMISVAYEDRQVHVKMPEGFSSVWKDQLSNTILHVKDSQLTVLLKPCGYLMLVPVVGKENE
jgi:glycosidase